MNKSTLIVAAIAITLTGCSSNKGTDVSKGNFISPGPQQAISEQRVVNDFKRQGVKVIYSLTGNLEAVEATGYAPVWGNSQNSVREAYRVAELEAKKAMNDFINTESIQTSVSVSMISKNLEKAKDNRTNNFATNRARDEVAAVTDDEEPNSGVTRTASNLAVRDDALRIASSVNTEMTLRNQGILSGLRLVEGEVVNSGKTVRVIYRWDKKHDEGRKEIRRLMMQ